MRPDAGAPPHGAGRWQPVTRRLRAAVIPVAAVVLGLVVGGVLIALQGNNPWDALVAIFHGAFDGRDAIGRTLEKATPLVLTGTAIIIGLKAGLFNIGAQGQLVFGAIFSAYIGYQLALPSVLHVPLALVVGGLIGAVPALLAAVLKITRGVHEVITTIMLNSVIIAITDWLASDPWRSPRAAFPKTPDIRSTAEIPRIDAIPLGFVLAVAVALLIAWVFRRTTVGFEVTTVGANRDAAHYAGISVNRMILLAMGLSGFLAGVGGAVETLGVLGHYEQGSSPTLGFDGITIALLARLNARATIPAALLIGAMRASDTKLQSEAGVAPDIVSVIVAVILLFVAAPALVRWLLRMKGGEGEPQIQLTTGWGG